MAGVVGCLHQRDALSPLKDKRKRPRDPAQFAKLIVDIATGEIEDRPPDPLPATCHIFVLFNDYIHTSRSTMRVVS